MPLRDGDEVAGWTAIHTPGHASDHLCFARDGMVFTADHIMSWSTSVVSPPHGNMRAYFESMRLHAGAATTPSTCPATARWWTTRCPSPAPC
jgi:glyoxylase-like metal-dependent hydrolase (beta-lactamase superfamily II)